MLRLRLGGHIGTYPGTGVSMVEVWVNGEKVTISEAGLRPNIRKAIVDRIRECRRGSAVFLPVWGIRHVGSLVNDPLVDMFVVMVLLGIEIEL